MANFEQNKDALSRDRWLIVDLEHENNFMLQARLAAQQQMALHVPIVNEEMADEYLEDAQDPGEGDELEQFFL